MGGGGSGRKSVIDVKEWMADAVKVSQAGVVRGEAVAGCTKMFAGGGRWCCGASRRRGWCEGVIEVKKWVADEAKVSDAVCERVKLGCVSQDVCGWVKMVMWRAGGARV